MTCFAAATSLRHPVRRAAAWLFRPRHSNSRPRVARLGGTTGTGRGTRAGKHRRRYADVVQNVWDV